VEVVYSHCCGLDIHKQLIVACVIAPGPNGRSRKEIRRFGAMTAEILQLGDWLAAQGVTHVAMEATGVYWQPIWNLLEDRFTLLLVNAQHIKAVPGRKTDVKDCEWIADLLRHGLLRPSFVPARPQRELRELTRYRTTLVGERSAEVNRLQKTLEGANIKLASVASDVLGVSGRQMVEALIAGETDAAALADCARGRLRDKLPQLQQALTGQVGPHQRFVLGQQLAHIDALDRVIAAVSAEIARRLCDGAPPLHATAGIAAWPGAGPTRSTELAPKDAGLVHRLRTIPGIGQRAAEIVLAEIGSDVRRFPTPAHLASWAGMCPGNHESAGKRISGKTRRGNPHLRSLLVEVAQAASRTRGTFLAARFQRLVKRLGYKKSLIALAHTILRVVYRLLADGGTYQERGPQAIDERTRQRAVRASLRRLQELGVAVALAPTPPQPAAAGS
jgi:transposase